MQIRCRPQDEGIVTSTFPDVLVKYREVTGKEIMLELDSETYLPANITGGVELVVQRVFLIAFI